MVETGFLDILKQITGEKGIDIFLDSKRFKSFLLDYTRNEYKKECDLLLRIIDANCINIIIKAENTVDCEQFLVKRLEDDYSLSPSKSVEMLDLLFLVLGRPIQQPSPINPILANSPPPIPKQSKQKPDFRLVSTVIAAIIGLAIGIIFGIGHVGIATIIVSTLSTGGIISTIFHGLLCLVIGGLVGYPIGKFISMIMNEGIVGFKNMEKGELEWAGASILGIIGMVAGGIVGFFGNRWAGFFGGLGFGALLGANIGLSFHLINKKRIVSLVIMFLAFIAGGLIGWVEIGILGVLASVFIVSLGVNLISSDSVA